MGRTKDKLKREMGHERNVQEDSRTEKAIDVKVRNCLIYYYMHARSVFCLMHPTSYVRTNLFLQSLQNPNETHQNMHIIK